MKRVAVASHLKIARSGRILFDGWLGFLHLRFRLLGDDFENPFVQVVREPLAEIVAALKSPGQAGCTRLGLKCLNHVPLVRVLNWTRVLDFGEIQHDRDAPRLRPRDFLDRSRVVKSGGGAETPPENRNDEICRIYQVMIDDGLPASGHGRDSIRIPVMILEPAVEALEVLLVPFRDYFPGYGDFLGHVAGTAEHDVECFSLLHEITVGVFLSRWPKGRYHSA